MVETGAAYALVNLAPGLPVVLGAEQDGVESGGGGVEVARGEDSDAGGFHCSQLQVDRTGVLLGARKSGRADVFLGATERHYHGPTGILQHQRRGRNHGGRHGGRRRRGQVLRPEGDTRQQEWCKLSHSSKGLSKHDSFIQKRICCQAVTSPVTDVVFFLNPRYDSGRTHPYHPNAPATSELGPLLIEHAFKDRKSV